MDLLLLVTPGRVPCFSDGHPKSELAGVCFIDLHGWVPQKQVKGQSDSAGSFFHI